VLKFIRILAAAYAAYALLMLEFAARNFVMFLSAAQADSSEPITFAVIAIFTVALTALLSYFLAVRRHQKAALIIAAVTCGFPIGTILGGLTIYALTRPDVSSEFMRRTI
jgi:hypothetical protein